MVQTFVVYFRTILSITPFHNPVYIKIMFYASASVLIMS